MADRNAKESPSASSSKSAGGGRTEPGPLFRLVAGEFWTLVAVAAVVSAMVGWVMHDTASAGRDIPAPMYAYLALGLALGLVCLVLYVARREQLELVWRRRRAVKEARVLLRESQRSRRRYAHRLSEERAAEVKAAEEALEQAQADGDWDAVANALNGLDARLEEHFPFARKSTAREYAESIAVAVLIALLLRSFVVEAFRIPSGSMIPTLQVGDHIFVNKFIYGVRIPFTDIKIGMSVRKPQRGEVIVFKYPKDPDKDFIKRIVGIEGDTVEIRNNQVLINGQPTEHVHETAKPCEYDDKLDENSERWEHRLCEAYDDKLGTHAFTTIYDKGSAARSWATVTVPPGHVFVMGDNRDNSHDSRYWGFVPFELIKGKAMIIWWSSGQPEGIRVKRMGRLVE